MLIGKIANRLLFIEYRAVLKAVDEFVRMRMREITRSVEVALKCLTAGARRRRFTVLDFKS